MPESRFAMSYPRWTSRRRWAAVLLILVLALVVWLIWRPVGTSDGGPAGGRMRPGAMMGGMAVPVKVAEARRQSMEVLLRALGTVTAYNTVTVRSQISGELVNVAFEEGQQVKAGDLLAQIDPRALNVALAQAQGQQQQNLAQLDNARRDLQRYQVLYKQESIARQQLDTQAALVRQYEGAIKSDQAAVDSAKLQLIYARITAPLSGRLGLRQVDQGNLVSSSDVNGLVVITQTQPISVVFSLPEIQLPDVREQLHAGQVLQVEAYDRADTKRIALGRLEVLDNQIDVATGTVKLKARFDNADDALFPNQFVNARLRVKTLPDATVIPSAAVQQGSAGAFVFLVQPDNTVLVRQVKLGVVNGAVVAVDEGLQAGDKVVVEGMDRLRAGARVDIVAQPVASTDAAAALSGAAPQMPAADAPAANAAAASALNAPSPGKAANGAPAGTERSARK